MVKGHATLLDHLRQTNPPPTLIEMGKLLGVSDTTARLWLMDMEAAGLLERVERTARGLRLTERGRRIPLGDVAYAVDRARIERKHGRTA